jgi:hypothetical protein
MIRRLQVELGATSSAAAEAGAAVDFDRIKPVLLRLAGLLDAADGEALEVILEQKAALRSALGPDFAALEKAVNDCDFDAALERLKGAAVRHAIVL